MSLSTARAISDYLLTGMHHATPEGQAAMGEIIDAKVNQLTLNLHLATEQERYSIGLRKLADEKLATVRADLTAFFTLLDLEEDSELTGKPFHPTRITSCRALDGQRINELLGRLKAFATSTP